MRELTAAEQVTNAETMRHILTVRTLLSAAAAELLARAQDHDASKLSDPEVAAFTEYTPKLAKCEYGSDEYRGYLREMGPAVKHHQTTNRHHPEWHGKAGVMGMNLFDLLEMLLDWKAAGLRHETGDLQKSLEINAKRFNMPEALVTLLANTIRTVEGLAKETRVALSYPHVELPDCGHTKRISNGSTWKCLDCGTEGVDA